MSMVKGNEFSCDLVSNAKLHLQFLKQCHLWMTSFKFDQPSILIESLRRYETLWLPLVASAQKTTTQALIPPPDLAWLWHCHRLAPKEYCDYCVKTFGFIVEANPPFAVAFPEVDDSHAIASTQALWNEQYPNKPFFLQDQPIDSSDSLSSADALPSIGGFNLLESTKRQATFLWQVSGPRFSDDDFLAEGVANYAKFLLLKPKAMQQRITLVPTYQIDLMWHTHMLVSMQQYHADCLRLMHSKLHHDDSLTDRSDGGVLDVSYRATKDLWQKEYGTDYVVCGGMYRGEPPEEYFAPHTSAWTRHDEIPVNMSPGGGMYHHLVGKVGATSTSPKPTQWASVNGVASDGRAAFIRTDAQTRREVKHLKYMEAYVLGRLNDTTGYYHIETKEAHYILLIRVQGRIRSAQWNVACCGMWDPKHRQKLQDLLDIEAELKNRLKAAAPIGSINTKRRIDDKALDCKDTAYAHFYSNAGGACGGASACGTGGACGSGGGGCGSGGGGGGCGGGGCGS